MWKKQKPAKPKPRKPGRWWFVVSDSGHAITLPGSKREAQMDARTWKRIGWRLRVVEVREVLRKR